MPGWLQNPGNDEPPNAGLSNKADYKGGQKKQFGGYRWIACHDPSLLDAERCEFILIGATEDLQGKYLGTRVPLNKGLIGLCNCYLLQAQIVPHLVMGDV